MQPFEVRRLEGSFAPSNGTADILSVTPNEWITNPAGTIGVNGIINEWSGGSKSISGTRLFVTGGGHQSAINGLYVFDFSGDSNPAGWETPVLISDVEDVISASPTYADGLPTAVHTYDGMIHATHNDHLYRFGGAWYHGAGSWTGASFKYDVDSGLWTRVPDYPAGSGSSKATWTLYDRVSRKIFVGTLAGSAGAFYRTDNDSWSDTKSVAVGGFESMGAWDTRRKRGIIVGRGANTIANVDFSAETISLSEFSPSGSTGVLSAWAISAVYDPVRDAYWLWGGDSDTGHYSTLYEMSAETFQVIAHPLSNTIESAGGQRGSYGRFVLLSNWRAIGFVADIDSPVYVIKLPTGSAPSVPRPPIVED